MDTEQQDTPAERQTQEPETAQAESTVAGEPAEYGGQEVLEELGRLGSKLVEVVDTAWNSEQRKRIEEDLRLGLTGVVKSLEEGLQDLSQDEQTKELLGKAEDVAENISYQVRSSEITRELAAGLASGLHILGDQLEQLVQEMKEANTSGTSQTDVSEESDEDEPRDIPIQG